MTNETPESRPDDAWRDPSADVPGDIWRNADESDTTGAYPEQGQTDYTTSDESYAETTYGSDSGSQGSYPVGSDAGTYGLRDSDSDTLGTGTGAVAGHGSTLASQFPDDGGDSSGLKQSVGDVKDGAVESASAVKDKAVESAGAVKDQAVASASEVKDVVVERGGEVAAVAKDELGRLAGDARDQLQDLWSQTRDQLWEQASAGQQHLADLLHTMAAELGEMASKSESGGPLTSLAKQGAERGGALSHWLSESEPSDVFAELRRFARRRPFAFLAGSVLAGVVVGRLSRSLAASASESSSSTPSGSRLVGAGGGGRVTGGSQYASTTAAATHAWPSETGSQVDQPDDMPWGTRTPPVLPEDVSGESGQSWPVQGGTQGGVPR